MKQGLTCVPSTDTERRVWPAMAATGPTAYPLDSSTGPCSMWISTYLQARQSMLMAPAESAAAAPLRTDLHHMHALHRSTSLLREGHHALFCDTIHRSRQQAVQGAQQGMKAPSDLVGDVSSARQSLLGALVAVLVQHI